VSRISAIYWNGSQTGSAVTSAADLPSVDAATPTLGPAAPAEHVGLLAHRFGEYCCQRYAASHGLGLEGGEILPRSGHGGTARIHLTTLAS
jgi:hypothetical protein